MKPLEHEQVAERWSALLVRCADQEGAPNFAWHMAERGCAPEIVRDMALRWREEEYQPVEFADELDAFADQVQALLAPGAQSGWPR